MDPAAPALAGGCHCGAVRYALHAVPTHRTLCHCSDCRGVHAAPVVAWCSVPPQAFRLVQGVPAQYHSSAGVTRSFCGVCGTPLTYRRDGDAFIDVATCSLDDPEAVPPADHTFTRSALHWAPMVDGLPRHDTARP